jgi:hypothetical protein
MYPDLHASTSRAARALQTDAQRPEQEKRRKITWVKKRVQIQKQQQLLQQQ